MKFRSLLPGESRAFGPGGHPDPAELTGGDAPPCAEPPVAPTFFGIFFSPIPFFFEPVLGCLIVFVKF